MKTFLVPLLLLSAVPVRAQDVDPSTLYDISTAGSSQKVKAGEKGKVVIEIRSKAGAHVSDEAPLKIELFGKEVTPEKQKLTIKDSVAKKQEGQAYADPRFEVPFTTSTAAKGSVDAKMTFFICTDKVCARQQKSISVPVEVD
ncbi:MAG: hypothetical protein ACOZIN_07590 [Myxococcota bacterium]